MVKGLFGLFGGRQREEMQEVIEEVAERKGLTEEEAFFAKDYLQHMLDIMGFVSVVKVVTNDEESLVLEIKSDDTGRIIGKEGSTLNALQYLLRQIVQKRSGKRANIVLDTNQYREKRAQTLEKKAEKAAKRALQENTEVKMGPMPAYERRIVHLALEGNKQVYTFSKGERDHRQVIVAPKKAPRQ